MGGCNRSSPGTATMPRAEHIHRERCAENIKRPVSTGEKNVRTKKRMRRVCTEYCNTQYTHKQQTISNRRAGTACAAYCAARVGMYLFDCAGMAGRESASDLSWGVRVIFLLRGNSQKKVRGFEYEHCTVRIRTTLLERVAFILLHLF